jgi:hypothetical protein
MGIMGSFRVSNFSLLGVVVNDDSQAAVRRQLSASHDPHRVR